jgi:uncharacterized C2H2 Zn-finger protein
MKSKKKETEVIIDVWSLSKNHKLPCHICEKEFTRTGLIKHLIKDHNWKPEDAKNAFKEVKLKKGQAVI